VERHTHKPEADMGSVYKVIEIVGTSSVSWEEAAREAITTASSTLRDLRVAEVLRQDVTIGEDGAPDEFRVRLSVSFKYESE
jgi:flavin-binding protein dodecin